MWRNLVINLKLDADEDGTIDTPKEVTLTLLGAFHTGVSVALAASAALLASF